MARLGAYGYDAERCKIFISIFLPHCARLFFLCDEVSNMTSDITHGVGIITHSCFEWGFFVLFGEHSADLFLIFTS